MPGGDGRRRGGAGGGRAGTAGVGVLAWGEAAAGATSSPSTTSWAPPAPERNLGTTMNTYGHRAMAYWRLHRPRDLAAITDPAAFFEELGDRVASEVEELETALAGTAPPGEGWTERVGRLNMARLMAEERVMAELGYSTWEDDEDEPPTDATGAYVGGPPGWEPLWPPGPPEPPEPPEPMDLEE